MNAHAILSPSASGRWIQCPASRRMVENVPEQPESIYALEGTQFHALCEIQAAKRFHQTPDFIFEMEMLDWFLETEDAWHEEQFSYMWDWLLFIEERVADEEVTILFEQQVNTGVPGCWGTADLILIYSDRIEIVDIKYGAGIRVSALENPQLRLYGAGALNIVDDPLTIGTVTTTVWQPRMNNVSSETLTRAELEAWRDDLIPIAELALSDVAPFGPSESACRWCPVSGDCGPRTRAMLNADYGDPDLLSGDEMAEAFSRIKALKQWAADIEDAALKRAYEEPGSVPGFKVVRSGGRRQIKDETKAINALIEAGFDPDDVSYPRIATLGTLDKLAGSPDKLQEALGDLLVRGEGRLSLAPDSDPRQPADAVHSAQDDFADVLE